MILPCVSSFASGKRSGRGFGGEYWQQVRLVEFRVEKSQEEQDKDAEEGKRTEGEIPDEKQCRPGGDMTRIDIKKTAAPGDEKYQPQHQK